VIATGIPANNFSGYPTKSFQHMPIRKNSKCNYTRLKLPANTHSTTRIAWAGERYADLCEGLMTPDVGWYVWNIIVGWTDLGATSAEEKAYKALAKQFADLLQAMKDNKK